MSTDPIKTAHSYYDKLANSGLDLTKRDVNVNMPLERPSPPVFHTNELVQKNRELERHGRTISVVSYICFVLTMISTCILAGIFYVSKTVDQERKGFLLLIIGLCGFGFILVMFIARRNSTTLLIFTVLSTFISGFSLGLSIGYA